jgi:2-keto-4-pentenoate hydratase/2-oxohepta-3-ene-1,7-dioic acid hydratase in catechol pathway
MRLVRFGPPGEEQPGVWIEGPDGALILDARGMAFDISDFDSHFFTHWGLERLAALLREKRRKLIPAASIRLGPPLARPGKIVCVGRNYADHAAEFNSAVPASPILFGKATTSLIGPFDPIVVAPGASRIDAEAELAVVIGRPGRAIAAEKAMDHVAGYAVLDDVTDRDAQEQGKQWFRGKGGDTFCPLGPFLVTRDEVEDPHALRVFSRVNGTPLQEGHTRDMLFRIPALIAFISRAISLEAGDVIATGTPAGVGSVRNPPVLLPPGAVVEVGVEGLGTQRNPVVAGV